MSSHLIFALDIGTRSVVGVVMQETPKGLEIIAADKVEHQTRAMIDGQIHDIEQVAKAIGIVKEKLETKIGRPLTQVAVAAAGRALKTVRLKTSTDVAESNEIHQDDILRLELQAVQEAQNNLAGDQFSEAEKLLNYHCVGYSVVHYELDGFVMGSLASQKGKTIGVEVIATFLPRVVIDSMISALTKVELEMTSLTLEPIAASTVVVPPGMRQLNVALVDIGAGTSDIAITAEGAIVGYGMAPVAGDEITEKLSSHYLVDFNQAEEIKRSIQNQEEMTFADILGMEHTVSRQQLLDVVHEAVLFLTKQISEKILELNGKTPQAVICIGGGSLTPLLREMLAEQVGLSKERIAVRGREAISSVYGAQELVGPESVTPIGIAVTSYERRGLGFARVVVNGRQVRLFEVNRCTVADVLLAAGVNMRQTQPRLGMAITVTVNGELKIIKGNRGKIATIKLNDEPVSLDHPAKHNDVVEFNAAQDGENASGYIYDVVPDFLPITVNVNGEVFTINPIITMNGHAVSYYDELVDNGKIEYYLPRKVKDILEISGIGPSGAELNIYVNERATSIDTEIGDGDDITVELMDGCPFIPEQQPELLRKAEPVASPENADTTVVFVNGEQIELPRSDVILTDIFTRTNFSLKPPESGMRLEMRVNSVNAEFTTPLKYGDTITLEWK